MHDVRWPVDRAADNHDPPMQPRIVRSPLANIGLQDVTRARQPLDHERELVRAERTRRKRKQNLCGTFGHRGECTGRITSGWLRLRICRFVRIAGWRSASTAPQPRVGSSSLAMRSGDRTPISATARLSASCPGVMAGLEAQREPLVSLATSCIISSPCMLFGAPASFSSNKITSASSRDARRASASSGRSYRRPPA